MAPTARRLLLCQLPDDLLLAAFQWLWRRRHPTFTVAAHRLRLVCRRFDAVVTRGGALRWATLRWAGGHPPIIAADVRILRLHLRVDPASMVDLDRLPLLRAPGLTHVLVRIRASGEPPPLSAAWSPPPHAGWTTGPRLRTLHVVIAGGAAWAQVLRERFVRPMLPGRAAPQRLLDLVVEHREDDTDTDTDDTDEDDDEDDRTAWAPPLHIPRLALRDAGTAAALLRDAVAALAVPPAALDVLDVACAPGLVAQWWCTVMQAASLPRLVVCYLDGDGSDADGAVHAARVPMLHLRVTVGPRPGPLLLRFEALLDALARVRPAHLPTSIAVDLEGADPTDWPEAVLPVGGVDVLRIVGLTHHPHWLVWAVWMCPRVLRLDGVCDAAFDGVDADTAAYARHHWWPRAVVVRDAGGLRRLSGLLSADWFGIGADRFDVTVDAGSTAAAEPMVPDVRDAWLWRLRHGRHRGHFGVHWRCRTDGDRALMREQVLRIAGTTETGRWSLTVL